MNKGFAAKVKIAMAGMLVLAFNASGLDQPVLFDTSAPGESKAIAEWGLDTAWDNTDNIRRGAIFMGASEVDYVRVTFPVDDILTAGELSAANKLEADYRVDHIAWAGLASKPLTMTPDTEAGVDPWYKSGSQVIPANWVQAMEATVDYYVNTKGKTIVAAAPFNEPDYGWNQGTKQNLYDICSILQTNPTFSGISLAGASTLNCSEANSWYNYIKSVVDEGTTHQLAGNFDDYASFYQNVVASGDKAVNEELHNSMEAMVGAEYGLEMGIWWGSAERARGEFVKACQGDRLGYAENRPNWTAASVYRAPSGAVKAFVGQSERQSNTGTYRFFCKDRPVFYDGHGPQRSYSVATTGNGIYGTFEGAVQPNGVTTCSPSSMGNTTSSTATAVWR